MILTYPALLYLLVPIAFLLFLALRKKIVKEEIRLFKISKKFIFVSRMLIFSCLLFAATMPYVEYHDTNGNVSKIKVLVDNSESMKLMEKEKALNKLNGLSIPVEITNMELGEYSSIGTSILNNMAPDENILLITDGQNNFGQELEDIALFASSINSRIFAMELEEKERDAAIFIEGPDKVISGVENIFTAKLSIVGTPGKKIIVTLDNEVLFEGPYSGPIEFRKSFDDGTHVFKAELDSDDYFKQNNVFLKAVTVTKKPKILFIGGKSSPTYKLYNDFYDIEYADKIPEKLESYHAVVLDNVNANSITGNDVDKLDDFLNDENGLLIMGGKDSYDYGGYNKSLITGLLPVSIGKAKKKQDEISLVIMLDSGVSGMEELKPGITRFDVQKSVTADILNGISGKNKVALIEANYYLNTVTGLSELGPKKEAVINDLALLSAHGSSQLRFAYKQAYDMLKLNTGSKNILLITDGNALIPQDQGQALDMVIKARSDGIKTFIVSVGENADEVFMKQVKTLGGGEYFKVDETSRLKLYFGSPGDDTEEKELSIFVYDSNHFITEDMEDINKVYGFNQVYPKPNSRMLLTTSKGDPILTIWNYGLGRVAALSTDDGSMWNPEMLKEKNSKTLLKTMNWLIENPERKNDFALEIPDLRVGESSVITVRSKELPKSELNFIEYEKGLYKANFYTEETGIMDILGTAAAVNYKKEYLNIGMNEDLRKSVMVSGGTMIEGLDENALSSMSRIEYTRNRDVSWVFVFIALVIYLIEITIRRIMEIKVSRDQ